MKKILVIIMALLTLGTAVSTVSAKDDKTEKAAQKAEKKAAKADKKAAKAEKRLVEYEELCANYQPLATIGVPAADDMVATLNIVVPALNSVYEKVGYIEFETHEAEDEITGEKVVVVDRAYDRRTGQDIDVEKKKSEYKECTAEFVAISASAVTLTSSVMGFAQDPKQLIALGLQGKNILKQAKMITAVVPLIREKIKTDSEIIETMKNN
ncbi:MAG: hypothetical protein KBT20_05205 [Bacteroidales bacterium]|nr:hypothetical protein [Candidatus Liminaster caballi]